MLLGIDLAFTILLIAISKASEFTHLAHFFYARRGPEMGEKVSSLLFFGKQHEVEFHWGYKCLHPLGHWRACAYEVEQGRDKEFPVSPTILLSLTTLFPWLAPESITRKHLQTAFALSSLRPQSIPKSPRTSVDEFTLLLKHHGMKTCVHTEISQCLEWLYS